MSINTYMRYKEFARRSLAQKSGQASPVGSMKSTRNKDEAKEKVEKLAKEMKKGPD